ncbi:hypothetical protein [Nocardia wallacei]|nr:hypothetical protein [Nocardia wallacei]
MDLWPLLVDDLLTGSYSIERQLRPRAVAIATRRNSIEDATEVVVALCSKWAGGAMPIISIDPAKPEISEKLSHIIQASNIDALEGRKILPQEVEERYSDIHGNATQYLLRQLVEDAIDRRVQTCRGIDFQDPWYISYLAIFGNLPTTADRDKNQYNDLRLDLTFDDLIDIRGVEAKPSARDLVERIKSGDAISAVNLTRIRLPAGLSAGYNKGFPSTSRFTYGQSTASSKFGPNIVVVYDPGSVDDLALIWNLRARFAHIDGLPVAIPYSDSTSDDIEIVAGSDGLCHYFGFDHNVALTSFSISQSALQEIDTDEIFSVVDPNDLLGEIYGYCVSSTEVVQFTEGSATIPSFSSTDIKELGQGYLGSSRATWLVLTTIIKNNVLPYSETMRRGKWRTEPGYLRGKISHVGELDSFRSISHPSGLETLHALGRDQNIELRPSDAGRAAEHLIRAADGNIAMLTAPGVVAVLSEMSRRGHASLVKRRLDQYLAGSDIIEGSDRYEELRAKLDLAIGTPDLEEVGYMTFNRIREILGISRNEASVWVEWAIAHRILIRGFEAECQYCNYHQWRAFADSVPELICHGCGRVIVNPFGVDRIEHRYRPSETLLRAMNSDVLAPILAMRHLAKILGKGAMFGAYPGIELFEPGAKQSMAEIDVLAVIANGKWVLGECKARARGLNEAELAKLWKAADRVNATVTFCATLDRANICGDVWRVLADPNGRPHFSLTAEHLYDLQSIGPTYGQDYFSWRSDYTIRRADGAEVSEKELNAEFGEFLLRVNSDTGKWRRAQWEVE